MPSAAARRMAAALSGNHPEEGLLLHSDSVLTLGFHPPARGRGPGGLAGDRERGLWLALDGEVHNDSELRRGLEQGGWQFQTDDPLEVLLRLYERDGNDFLRQLRGAWVLALWDGRERQLMLARDHLGQKPLYYCSDGGQLLFASRARALPAGTGRSVGVDAQTLREHLGLGYAIGPNTLFEGIRKLPPASLLLWQQDAPYRCATYWSLPRKVDQTVSASQWAAQIRAGLETAVQEQMAGEGRVGAFLSGGIDSGAIVGLMARHSTTPVDTFSIGYAGSGAAAYYNELEFARVVADRWKTAHREELVNPGVATLLPHLLWHVEEPLSDSAIVTSHLAADLASGSVDHVLSGIGGDELFAGYRRYLGDHYTRRYRMIPGWLRRGLVQPLIQRLPSGRGSRLLDLSRYARAFVRSAELPWSAQYREYLEICDPDRLEELFLARCADEDGFDRVLAAENSDDPLLRLLRVDARTQLSEDLLLLTGKILSAHALSCRAPFLDIRLVELAARIPAQLKLPGGELKHLLKQALSGVVPDEIMRRRKRGFGAPMGSWLKTELLPLRNLLLDRDSVERRGLFAWPAMASLLALHDASREDFTDLILALMNVELWCRLFMDGRDAQDIGAELAERLVA